MLRTISIKILLNLCCGLQHWRSCSSHLKNIYIPYFKIFLPSNIGRINPYLPDVVALELRLLFMELCLFLSSVYIHRKHISSTSAMFAFHSSRGQLKLSTIPWNVNTSKRRPYVHTYHQKDKKLHAIFISFPPITKLNKNPVSWFGIFGISLLSCLTVRSRLCRDDNNIDRF